MSSRTKTRASNLPVPQSRDEAAAAVTKIGGLTRDIARIKADMNDELAAVRERHEAHAALLSQLMQTLHDGLQVWAEANRSTLTGGDKTKTVNLGTGEIKWRIAPPSVRVRGEDLVIGALHRMGLERFVRVKESVNKQAMQAEPEVARSVPGVTVGSAGEDFVVAPFEVALSAEGGGHGAS